MIRLREDRAFGGESGSPERGCWTCRRQWSVHHRWLHGIYMFVYLYICICMYCWITIIFACFWMSDYVRCRFTELAPPCITFLDGRRIVQNDVEWTNLYNLIFFYRKAIIIPKRVWNMRKAVARLIRPLVCPWAYRYCFMCFICMTWSSLPRYVGRFCICNDICRFIELSVLG